MAPATADPSPIDLPMRKHGLVVVVIETSFGSGTKVKFEADLGLYRADRVLPVGMTFPFNFGFIPQTLAEDGDPLDAIVLLDAPIYPGCVVYARLLGVLEAEQQGGGKGPWERNDRVIGVVGGPKGHSSMRSLRDVDAFQLESIESFFESYHGLDGDRFRPIRRGGVRVAETTIRRAHAAYQDARQSEGRGGTAA